MPHDPDLMPNFMKGREGEGLENVRHADVIWPWMSEASSDPRVTTQYPRPSPPIRATRDYNRQKREKPQFPAAFTTPFTGAGEGIRTLDPNLGKVVLYP
jgi:hypothetical protein